MSAVIDDLFRCRECSGTGVILVTAEGCCGDVLPSGECCAAIYGTARLVIVFRHRLHCHSHRGAPMSRGHDFLDVTPWHEEPPVIPWHEPPERRRHVLVPLLLAGLAVAVVWWHPWT